MDMKATAKSEPKEEPRIKAEPDDANVSSIDDIPSVQSTGGTPTGETAPPSSIVRTAENASRGSQGSRPTGVTKVKASAKAARFNKIRETVSISILSILPECPWLCFCSVC